MKRGLLLLSFGYVLSQFYRAFLAVLAPDLVADLGLTAADLSRASAFWFLGFALAQLPIGWALDHFGPRRTSGWLLGGAGGGGAALFAVATTSGQVDLAMALIGVGCGPVLMASYYIFARTYRPAIFATLAGLSLGVGSLGNIAASVPLGLAAEALGWRGAMLALAVLTAATGLGCLRLVRDPEALPDGPRGSLIGLLRTPALWAILPMMLVNYAPAAGLRGLWAGPYIAGSYGTEHVGRVTFLMGLAMIAGSLVYSPLDRLLGTRKWVVLGGNLICAAMLTILWLNPVPGLFASTLLLSAVGFFGMTYAVCITHGRAFIPPALMGRGVAFLNLLSVGGVGLMQLATGPIFEAAGGGMAGYRSLFATFALALLAGCAIYAFSRDSRD